MIQLGDTIPSFSQAASSGTITQDNFLGKWTVLYFYPKDNTPGCTLESQDFRDHMNALSEIGVQVFGLSRDNLKSHQKFIDQEQLPFPLIADENELICSLFDVVKDKNMYGKKVRGIQRSTFIFNPKGQLAHEWRNVKVPGHVEEVINTLKTLIS